MEASGVDGWSRREGAERGGVVQRRSREQGLGGKRTQRSKRKGADRRPAKAERRTRTSRIQ
jgi:hypothetical protein